MNIKKLVESIDIKRILTLAWNDEERDGMSWEILYLKFINYISNLLMNLEHCLQEYNANEWEWDWDVHR